MVVEENKEYELIGIVSDFNDSLADTYPVIFQIENGEKVTLRLKKGIEVKCGEAYKINGKGIQYKQKVHIMVETILPLSETGLSDEEKDKALSSILGLQNINYQTIDGFILSEIKGFKNKIIKDITLTIYKKYHDQFIDYPAATRFHHAYKHGLIYHTYNSLRLVKMYVSIYPNINRDLAEAGMILHDIMKIREINSFQGEYSLEGKLLGHITMAGEEVYKTSCDLGYEGTKEALLLNHIVISHHNEPEFGSPRRAQIIEALIVHLADLADAKIEPVVEALEKTEVDGMTEQISVCEKTKFYKHGL